MNKTTPSASLEPAVLVIFGITGDLSQKKLLPALYNLAKNNLLPAHFEVIGVTRQELTLEQLVAMMERSIKGAGMELETGVTNWLRQRLHVWRMDLTQPDGYSKLYTYINSLEDKAQLHLNRLYYLSVPPEVFGPVVRLLGTHGHNASCQHGAASTRLLVEKPFGYDLASAKQLIREINRAYGDFQVYRIDHYLAKETVQNILTFRFKNPLFEAVWSHKEISHIMISATETLDIQDRVSFYEQTGALRDLIQSHLLQLLALITMEAPITMESKDIHAARAQALKSVRPTQASKVNQQVVLGQYENYRRDVSNPDSMVETYAALKLAIRHKHWKNTPVFLRTGKSLAKKETTISVVFRTHHSDQPRNCLIFHLQPDEGITVRLHAKKPGLTNEVEEVPMEFKYSNSFVGSHPDAYQRVLLDVIKGDKTLFATAEEVLVSWNIIEAIIRSPSKNLEVYPSKSEGPSVADQLLKPYETGW